MTDDPYNLQRFLDAQRTSYERALCELRTGRKRRHWMWYIFPQFAGLGFSPTAQLYAITSANEAQAYLAHPELGPRLLTCVEATLAHSNRRADDIFDYPDNLKFFSSLTLFTSLPGSSPLFQQALDIFFAGEQDARTLELLAQA